LRIFKGDAALLRIQGNNSSSYLGGVHLDDGGSLAFRRNRDRAVFGHGGAAVIRLVGHHDDFFGGGYLHAFSGVELIEVLDALVDAVGFGPAVIQVNDKLTSVGIHLLDGAGGFGYFHLVDGLRLVVLLLRNGAGPRAEQ